MHVAFMISSLQKGGSERVMCNIANYFAEHGHQVTMITQYKKEEEYPLHEKINRVLSEITPEETKGRIHNFLHRFFKLRNIWKEGKPDVILSFIGKNNIMTLLTSWGLSIPVVVSVRADPKQEYPQGMMRFMARHLFQRAAGVVLQTKECISFFPQKIRKKAVILRNPIDESFFRNAYEGTREHTIVTVGRLDENKNQQLLLRAFAEIASEYPDYKVILYGKGESETILKKLVGELGIEKQVEFPGSVTDVAEKIRKAGVFVLTSNTEGMPNALIEAMVLGLPVIATDCPCGGPADLIDHGENGLLTPVGDVNKMKENLQMLLNNLQKASEMGCNAKRTTAIYRETTVYREWYDYLLKIAEEF